MKMVVIERKRIADYTKEEWDKMFIATCGDLPSRMYVNMLMEHYGYTNYQAVEQAYMKLIERQHPHVLIKQKF